MVNFSPDSSGNPVIVRLLRKLAMTDCNGKQELHLKNAIGLASNLFDKYKNKKATSV